MICLFQKGIYAKSVVIKEQRKNIQRKSQNHQIMKKILRPQIEEHWKKIVEHHEKNNIKIPHKFVDLFAKHLVAGTPLEPSLPLTLGNICEELG